MFTITPITVSGLLVLHAVMFIIFKSMKPKLSDAEHKTTLLIGVIWAVVAFLANVTFPHLGLTSPMPLLPNILHSAIWVGICLPALYFGIRDRHSLLIQFIYVTFFCFVARYAERLLFGTWEQDHFLHILQGNFYYILGWSLVNGPYSLATRYLLRICSKFIRGLAIA